MSVGTTAASGPKKFPMTRKGYEALKAELEHLLKIERPANIEAIEKARALGDLSENADYSAAKEHQAWISMRMAEIENKIALAEVIDVTKVKASHVVFGATVTLADLSSDQEITYRIVGADEADPKANTISIESPIARALIGKEEGDDVTVKTPSGIKEYGIVSIQYVE